MDVDLQSIVKNITADHIVIDQWKGITERTCPAFYHRKNTKKPNKAPAPHKARSYYCRFARSTIGLSKEQGVERLKDAIRQATVRNLTVEEKERAAQRQVRIIVWCAEMEEKIFSQAGVNLDNLGSDVRMWDFQIWMP